MLYCSNCIDSVIPPKTPVLKRENAEIYNISSNDNFVCSNCKKKVIICNLKNNNVQTKDLKNKHNDDPLDDIYNIYSIINFLSYKP